MESRQDSRVRALLQPKQYGKKKSSKVDSKDADVKSNESASIDESLSANKAAADGATRELRALYNPRALLNPKGGRTQEAKLKFPAEHRTGQLDQVDMKHDGNEKLDFKISGSRSMLETFHGLEHRGGRAHKRVKVDATNEESEQPKSKFINSNHRGHGVIGGYMRPKDEKHSAAELANLVDLTNDEEVSNGDDNDYEVIRAVNLANEQEVCFGMIYTDIHAHAIPATSGKSQFTLPTQWPVIKCTLSREHPEDTVIDVRDPEGFVFGKVATDVARVLAPVMDSMRKLRTQARLTNRPRRDAERPHQSCSARMKMMVNIYGRKGDAEKIGKVFGQHNIWLKNPMGAEVGYPTCNPHVNRAPAIVPPSLSRSSNATSDTRTIEEATQAVSRVFDHFANTAKPLEETEATSLIVTPLLPHQKQALTFMTCQEQQRTFGISEGENSSLWRKKIRPNGTIQYQEVVTGITVKEEPDQVFGGLLADVMGLGKTLEALALITSTINQARLFGKEKLVPHDSDEGILQTQSRATLIVAPVSTIKNWEDQIAEHIKRDAIKYYVYHGPTREKNPLDLANFDIVISTYSTIAIECSKKASSLSPVRQVKWFRIILDEAHTIREPKATQSQAMYGLSTQRRWCLTGTPIQNRIDDLGSLTRFLRLYPYDTALRFNQYIRGPAISGDANFLKALRIFVDSFTLRRLKDRIDLPPRQNLVEKLEFSPEEQQLHDFFKDASRYQLEKLSKQQSSATTSSGLQHSQVLRSIMTLRLISAHGRELLKEKDLERLKGQTLRDAIDVDEDKLPDISQRAAYESLSLMEEAELDVCRNCDKRITEDSLSDGEDNTAHVRAYILPCLDIICVDCFDTYRAMFEPVDLLTEISCPFCSLRMTSRYITIDRSIAEVLDAAPNEPPARSRAEFKRGDYGGPHTKTKALLRDLDEMTVESKTFTDKGEPPIKCVVFSEFTSHLDLLERALSDRGYKYARIDGTMSLVQRKRVLDELNRNNQVTILLASIKAAGQGLNLTAASRAFIMEPLWNPAAEIQAVDRVYRIGQKREVIVKRYQMEASIELQIIKLQEKKQQLADLSMNKNHQALSKKELRAEHMKALLNLFNDTPELDSTSPRFLTGKANAAIAVGSHHDHGFWYCFKVSSVTACSGSIFKCNQEAFKQETNATIQDCCKIAEAQLAG